MKKTKLSKKRKLLMKKSSHQGCTNSKVSYFFIFEYRFYRYEGSLTTPACNQIVQVSFKMERKQGQTLSIRT